MKMRWWILFSTLFLFPTLSVSEAGNRNTYPLPEERGTAGTLSALQKLPVYVRVLQITAHPDDESAGALTWLSRNRHATTALFCLTRGEGGQNILGDEKYEALGLVRTGELVESSRYYGTDLYFGKVIDFGFSKTADETLEKWDRELTLAELVRFIRQWRPTIVLSRFSGSPADGHGHHQAAGQLAREAFRAAADPARYPGTPWQAKKLYVSSFGPAPEAIRIPVGDYDPVLGRSYREIGSEGYSKHRSQGNAMTYSLSGRGDEYFLLADSAAGYGGVNGDLFHSIDTSLRSISEFAGKGNPAVPSLPDAMAMLEKDALAAIAAFDPSAPEKSAAAVHHGIGILTGTIEEVRKSSMSNRVKELVLDALGNKLDDFHTALSAVLGIRFFALSEQATVTPGDEIQVAAYFHNRGSESVSLKDVRLLAPGDAVRKENRFGQLPPGSTAVIGYSVGIAPDAQPTRSHWHLADPRAARYEIRPDTDEFAPFHAQEMIAEAVYLYKGTEIPVRGPVRAQAGDQLRGSDFVDVQIVPAVSLSLEPELAVVPFDDKPRSCKVRITVATNRTGGSRGRVRIESEPQLKIRPAELDFGLSRKGESFTAAFEVELPPDSRKERYSLAAVATVDGRQVRDGFRVISYPENWTRNHYRPARMEIRRFDAGIRPGLMVGYVPGAGDDIPQALEQLGIKVQVLSGHDLAFGELDLFGAIVTGIRAYNLNDSLKANNRRLLDYVARGGTLIVQYVRPERGGSATFDYGPYPMTVSSASRITVEESPVRILPPAHPVFSKPNMITDADFQGWVQERGLYFMESWDQRYSALLSGNDPGEQAQSGGMLYTRYGKGHYFYTGYSWFRQLPAGVPGAFRIFANMLSMGQ